MRKRCKRKPVQVNPASSTELLSRASAQPISPKNLLDTDAACLLALDTLKRQNGDVAHALATLVAMCNQCLMFAELGMCDERGMKPAQDAQDEIAKQVQAWVTKGRLHMTGEAIAALTDACALYKAQAEMATEAQRLEAIQEVRRRVKAGAVVTII